MNKAYILLGTNLGDKMNNIKTACDEISSSCGNIVKRSAVYETSPWGITEQSFFLNCVIQLDTLHSPEKLLTLLLETEKKMGRVRLQKWGERLIDLDILYFNDLVFSTDVLKIPHPELQNRNFVLTPLCEIAAEELHPALHKTNRQLLEDCPDKGTVTKLPTS